MRLFGITLDDNKHIKYALTAIYGIGLSRSSEILDACGIDPTTKVKDLSEDDAVKIRKYIEQNYKIEGDLRGEVASNIKALIEMGAYRGIRHARRLPVRGQRTRTNARTRKGKRKTATSGRVKITKK